MCGAARILFNILEPRFQRVIKLLFNYKQNIRASPLRALGRVRREENEGRFAGRGRAAFHRSCPAAQSIRGRPAGPSDKVPFSVASEGPEPVSRCPSRPVPGQTPRLVLRFCSTRAAHPAPARLLPKARGCCTGSTGRASAETGTSNHGGVGLPAGLRLRGHLQGRGGRPDPGASGASREPAWCAESRQRQTSAPSWSSGSAAELAEGGLSPPASSLGEPLPVPLIWASLAGASRDPASWSPSRCFPETIPNSGH